MQVPSPEAVSPRLEEAHSHTSTQQQQQQSPDIMRLQTQMEKQYSDLRAALASIQQTITQSSAPLPTMPPFQVCSPINKWNNRGSCRASPQGLPSATYPGRGFGFTFVTVRGRMR